MAFEYVLNFERISIEVAEEEMSMMTNSNISSEYRELEGALDETALAQNLRHGAVAITFIVNLYETALNTIISKRLKCKDINMLKSSHYIKLYLVCAAFGLEFCSVKSNKSFATVLEAIKVRNDITHYKTNELCMGHVVATSSKIPLGTAKKTLAELFTQKNMRKYYDGILGFLRFLCSQCGLKLVVDCDIIGCDGMQEGFEFISDI